MTDFIHYVQQAADQYLKVKAESIKTWRSPCHCINPGAQEACSQCPAFRALVQQIQIQLNSEGLDSIPALLPPELPQNDTETLQQHCRELYSCGYSLEQIQWMTGITNYRKMRRWLRAMGLMGGTTGKEYPVEMKETCLQLYQAGAVPRQIEAQLGIPADVIIYWVGNAGLSRPKRHYTEAERQRCIELYQQGNSCETVESMTGVSTSAVKKWIKEAGIKRERIFGGGRPKTFSLEFRQQCMQLLLEGKTSTQVGMMMGVSADTIRRWRKSSSQGE